MSPAESTSLGVWSEQYDWHFSPSGSTTNRTSPYRTTTPTSGVRRTPCREESQKNIACHGWDQTEM